MPNAASTNQVYRCPNHWLMRSPDALFVCASCTSATIRSKVLSPTTVRTEISSGPSRFWVPPMTFVPFSTDTGTDSPVIDAWLTELKPSTTVPSTGIDVKLGTRTTSPTASVSTGTVLSAPSRTRIASLGRSLTREEIASLVRLIARSSITLERLNRKSKIAASPG